MTKQVTHIQGRRWFQPGYGNTYHTVNIFYSDGTNEYLPMQYGYGDHYLQTAIEHIHGKVDGPIWRYLEAQNITCNVIDVSRKRDL